MSVEDASTRSAPQHPLSYPPPLLPIIQVLAQMSLPQRALP